MVFESLGLGTVYHVKVNVPSLQQIELIGIPHGLRFVPRTKSVDRYLIKVLTNHPGVIYSEGERVKGLKYMVPKSLRSRVKPIELASLRNFLRKQPHYFSTFNLLKYGLKSVYEGQSIPKKIMITAISPLMFAGLDLAKHNAPISVSRKAGKRKSSKDKQKTLKNIPADYTGFVFNFRSLLMASRFLEEIRTHNKPAVLLTGADHTVQIQHFLENPELALNYVRKVRQTVADTKHEETYRPFLEHAEKQFTTLLSNKK